MKTTITISAVLVAAVAACADRPPPRQPNTTATDTTTTTSYSAYQHHTYPQQSSSTTSSYGQESPGAMSTIGTSGTDGTYSTTSDGAVRNTPLAPPPEPALNEPDANARPVAPQPAPANAKSPDGKSPNASAATDQGNSKGEVQISAAIRKRLVASNTLSFGAKNVKVITQGTKVTLRGNVKTEAERTEIEGVARNTDGVTEVENQLIVKK